MEVRKYGQKILGSCSNLFEQRSDKLGPKHFKLFNSGLDIDGYEDIIKKWWEEMKGEGHIQGKIKTVIKRVKE